MRPKTRLALIAILLSCANSPLVAREWVDSGGNTFEAELVEVKKNVAVFKKEDGKIVRMPLSKLSEESRANVQDSGDAEPSAKMKTPAAKPKSKPAGKKSPTASGDKPVAKSKGYAIEVVGLQINKSRPLKPGDTRTEGEPYRGEVGTELTLLVSVSGNTVVQVLEENCKLTAFTDDTGRDLLQDVRQDKYSGLLRADSNMFDHVDPDGAMLGVHTRHAPSPGATRLHLTGELAVRCAAGEKSEDHANMVLGAPGEAKLGSAVLKFAPGLEQSAPPPFGQGAFVTVTTDEATPLLKKIIFLDADGGEIKKTRLSWSWGVGFEVTYALKTKPENATVRIVSYEKVEDRTLPIDIEFALGL